MGAEWRRATVLELQREGILLVEDGNHGEYRPCAQEFVHNGVAFIRAADMDNGRVLFGAASKIDNIARQRITKGIGAGGDVLLSHKGTVGKLALAPLNSPPFVCSPQTTFWRTLDNNRLDRRFLYVFMRSTEFRQQLATRSGETDMAPYVSLTSQRGLHVSLPPIEEQRRIAHILGTLDDKIELNRRMNETLEAMARALFKSWFESHASEVRDRSVQELIDQRVMLIGDGYRAKNSEFAAGGLPFVRAGNLKGDGFDLAGAEVLSARSVLAAGHKVGHVNDVAFTSKGTVGRITRVSLKTGPFVYSPQVCFWRALATDQLNPSVLYRWMRTDDFDRQVAAVSTQTDMAPYVSLQDQRKMVIRMPPPEAQREIAKQLEPIDHSIAANAEQTRTLASLRDGLLPRLLSGDLPVTGVERNVFQRRHS